MESISSIITKKPFCDKLVTGNFIERVSGVLDEYFFGAKNPPEIALITTEKDYLFIGKTLKDRLTDVGKSVTVFVFERIEGVEFLECYDAAVIVGDADYAGIVCVKARSKPVVIVSSSLVFSPVFSFVYETSPITKEKGDLYKFVLDTEIYKGLRRKDFADGYAFTASMCLLKFECAVLRAFGEKIPDEVDDLLDSAYRTLSYINKENIVGVITVAGIYIMNALWLYPKILDTGAVYCGKILSCMTGLNKYECTLASFGPLLAFFKAYLKLNKDIAIVPFVREDAEKLAERLRVDSLEVYEKIDFLSSDKIALRKTGLKDCKNIVSIIDETETRLKELKVRYANVYNARHKRGECDKKDVLKALTLSGVLAKGSVGLMYYDGFLSALAQI